MTPENDQPGAPIMTQPAPSGGATASGISTSDNTAIPLGATETTSLKTSDQGKDYGGTPADGYDS